MSTWVRNIVDLPCSCGCSPTARVDLCSMSATSCSPSLGHAHAAAFHLDGVAPRRRPRRLRVGDDRRDLAERVVVLLGQARVGGEDDVGLRCRRRPRSRCRRSRRTARASRRRARRASPSPTAAGRRRRRRRSWRPPCRPGRRRARAGPRGWPSCTVATRSGFASIVVVPNACVMLTGVHPASVADVGSPAEVDDEQAARPTVMTIAADQPSRRDVRSIYFLPV